MDLKEQLSNGILLTTLEKLAHYPCKRLVWPATFGPACCAIKLFHTARPRRDRARFSLGRASSAPRQAGPAQTAP